MTRKYKEVYDIVLDEVLEHRGHIDLFQGGRLCISFNAKQPTAGHAFRAGICAMKLINALREKGYDEVQCGFDTGMAWVGAMPAANGEPAHRAIVGSVVESARALADKCANYDSTENVRCLTSSRFRDDLATSLFFQYIDIVPGNASATPSSKPLGLLSIAGRKEIDEGDCDEWIYELENHDAIDPFTQINKCFELILFGDVEGAQQLLHDHDALKNCPATLKERLLAYCE